LFIQDEDGNEQEFEIILTFTHPDTSVHYVVYKELADTDEVYAARYEESSDIAGTLQEIDTDEEFDMIQEVLDAFFADEE
jgi:uncharacterized protein YrzB (UPF0473 family)